MNELQIFNNSDFGTIRALEIDDRWWFVAEDVAKVLCLGASELRKILIDCVDIEDRQQLEDGITIIKNSNLYSFVVRSKFPHAEAFGTWLELELSTSTIPGVEIITSNYLKNYLKIFEHPDFGTIRTIRLKDAPWFVAEDIRVLGYDRYMVGCAKSVVADEDKTYQLLPTSWGVRLHFLITPKALYSLLATNESREKMVEPFKRWLESEILPAINQKCGWEEK